AFIPTRPGRRLAALWRRASPGADAGPIAHSPDLFAPGTVGRHPRRHRPLWETVPYRTASRSLGAGAKATAARPEECLCLEDARPGVYRGRHIAPIHHRQGPFAE